MQARVRFSSSGAAPQKIVLTFGSGYLSTMGCLLKSEHDRGHEMGQSHFILLQRLQERFKLKTRKRNNSGALPQTQVQDDHEPIDVKHRQHGDQCIGLR